MTQQRRKLSKPSRRKIIREHDLRPRMREFMRSLKAASLRGDYTDLKGAFCDSYEVETSAGRLRVSVYPDWIATQFDAPEVACKLVGADRINGKWNHHSFVETGTFYSRDDAIGALDRVFTRFTNALTRIASSAHATHDQLDGLAMMIADAACRDINRLTPNASSRIPMPYKTQYVLEKVVEILQERI